MTQLNYSLRLCLILTAQFNKSAHFLFSLYYLLYLHQLKETPAQENHALFLIDPCRKKTLLCSVAKSAACCDDFLLHIICEK